MAERVISGVKVPLVGDDERMHRAINRSIDDLKKLKTEIASTGVATAKQAREVMVLEERISSMVKAQDKASSTFGSGASRLGQMKEKVSSVAGAMSGLASTMGTAGGAVGKFGSIGAQAFGAFAVGGPIALGLAAVGAAAAYLVGEYNAVQQAADDAAESARKLNQAISSSMQDSVSKTEDLKRQLRTLKSGATTVGIEDTYARQIQLREDAASFAQQEMQAAVAKLAIDKKVADFGRVQNEGDKIRLDALKQEAQFADERLKDRAQISAAASLDLSETTKQLAILEQIKAEEEKRAKAGEKTLKVHKEITKEIKTAISSLEDFVGPKLSGDNRTQITLSDYESWIAQQQRGGGVGDFRSSGSGVGTNLALQREAEGKTLVDAADFGRDLRKASKAGGKEFAHSAMNSLLQSGSPFSGGASIAAGMADGVATKLADALKKGFDTLASAVGQGMDFILGSSKFGGMGSKGAGVASSVFAGHAALSMASGPLATVIGGPVRGAALAGAAGGASMLPEMMMRATMETKSYAKTMHAMNGIFKGAVMVMEPVFATLAPSLGLVGMLFRNLAQDLAPFTDVMGEVFGDALFKGVRGLAYTAVNAAVGVSSLNIAAMKATAGMHLMAAQAFNNANLPQQGAAAFEAYLQTMVDIEGAMNGHADLLGTRAEVEGMVASEGQALFDALAYLGEGVFDLGDATSDVASSMRNIPDFFNVNRAKRDSGATSTAPGPVVTTEMGNATKGPASGGFSVGDGGLYVNTLVVPSENPQQLAMRLMHASYTTSGRQVGSGEPSRTSSYRNGDY